MNRSARSSEARASFRDERADAMREQPTDGELAMSAILQEIGREGIDWVRQHSVHLPNGKGCVLDFLVMKLSPCREMIQVAIEVDGPVHNKKRRGHDARRTRALNKLGIPVIRFRNDDVIANPVAVRHSIESCLKEMEGK